MSELEAFRDAVLGDASASIVPLSEGVGVLEVAEELLGKQMHVDRPQLSI